MILLAADGTLVWIKLVIEKPEKVEVQSDGRIRKWAKISEAGKYLRVILLEDGQEESTS